MGNAQPPSSKPPYRILIIAEEGPVSDHITQALARADDLEISGPFPVGVDAVSHFRKQHLDAIVIDIGMQNENALVTLGRLLKIDPNAKILMASTLSFVNVKKSMEGLQRGAADFIQTPAGFTKNRSRREFVENLLRSLRSLAEARRQEGTREVGQKPLTQSPPQEKIVLRPLRTERPDIIAVASSTGGPQALHQLLENLSPSIEEPILITQHMPKTFTSVLSKNLNKHTNRDVVEAMDGDEIKNDVVYIAPGGCHMRVDKKGRVPIIKLSDDPPINYCKPSADPMLSSIAKHFGAKVLTVVLTGMGTDGKNGARDVIDAGGQVIAQDFETSIVWGMPGAVAKAGYCSKVLPLKEIAPFINSLFD